MANASVWLANGEREESAMHVLRRLGAAFALMAGAVVCMMGSAIVAPALAQQPTPWEIGMQTAGSPVAEKIHTLHALVFWIITAVTVFVGVLIVYVLYRFSAKRNPVPSQLSHHTGLEVAWTLVPVLILVVIAIPSFRLVYYEDRTANADMTIKVTGHQWYWEYSYPDHGNVDFSSYYIKDDDATPHIRLLDVDNPLVLPAGKNIRILTTSGDVIHSFFIPSLGVQRYAIPGRIIETWVRIDKPGQYYGECNQICGTNHSFMPISIKAVTPEEFATWVAQAKTKFASDAPAPMPAPAGRVAIAQAQPISAPLPAGDAQ
jgi:cytochrome c oxidase subunit 2